MTKIWSDIYETDPEILTIKKEKAKKLIEACFNCSADYMDIGDSEIDWDGFGDVRKYQDEIIYADD